MIADAVDAGESRRRRIAWFYGNMMAVAAEARRLAWATAWATAQGKDEREARP